MQPALYGYVYEKACVGEKMVYLGDFSQRLLAPRAAGLIYFLLALSAGLRSLISLPLPLAAVQVHHARSIKGCEREASNLLWGHLSLDLDGAARLVRTRWSFQ